MMAAGGEARALAPTAEDMLVRAKSQYISWRTGTKGKLKARFTAVRVRTADGPPQLIKNKGQQHLPGDEAWLLGERNATSPTCVPAPICAHRLPPSSHGSANRPNSR
jgi:SRSO17 transposase